MGNEKKPYPAILDDEVVGSEARKLLADAKDMLTDLSTRKALECKGVLAFYEAYRQDDDLIVKTSNANYNYHMFRQQKENSGYLSLADYVASKDNDTTDYIGAFAVTAGLGIDALIDQYKSENDDFKGIMVKILADRLAEAFAEKLHADVRKELWAMRRMSL